MCWGTLPTVLQSSLGSGPGWGDTALDKVQRKAHAGGPHSKNRMWGGGMADFPNPDLCLLLAKLLPDPQPLAPAMGAQGLSRNGPCPVLMAPAGSGHWPSLEKPHQAVCLSGAENGRGGGLGWGRSMVPLCCPQPPMPEGQTQENLQSLGPASFPDNAVQPERRCH